MASTSSSGHAESQYLYKDGQVSQVNALGDRNEASTTTAMVPSRVIHSLAAWLLGCMQYTYGVLGYLSTCLPTAQVNEQETDETILGVNDQPGVLSVDDCNVAGSGHSLESKHKVFLSHSGAQKDFVEQLCVDLERCDRYPFFDKRRSSLPIGEKFPMLIFDAIEQCRVGVVVLSEDFFLRSKWPMLELNAMVKEFGKPNPSMKIVPVFYRISIQALKYPKNHSQWILQWKKWALNDKRINVEEWMKALKVLGSINSVVIKKDLGDVKFREEIVTEVCALVPPETKWDDSHVHGRLRICKVIHDKMEQVSTDSRICVVGLYGVGGIGKTTISKVLCNDLSPKFRDNVCHVELGSASEMELLRKTLKKLTNIRHDILDKLDDIGQGCTYLKKKVHSQPTFLTLDNVQDDYKSKEIAQTYLKAGFGCGSVVLVTARSLDVLKNLNLDENNCLEMPELEENEARSLLLNHADLASGNKVDEVLVKSSIERCHFLKGDSKSRHYHPLALKVLGQQLGCNTSQWAAQLRKVDTFNQPGEREHPVFSILRNSFDSLDLEYQLLFMDLALFTTVEFDAPSAGVTRREWLCMVHEETVEDMKEMLEVLKRKSLVEGCDDFINIGIHDLWCEFAVAETKAQDFRERRWVHHVDGRRALGRIGQHRDSVVGMCFLNEGWRGLNGVKLEDFGNVTSFQLKVQILTSDGALDLDLSGLKRLKSLDIFAPGLAVRADGLSSLTNLAVLSWYTPGYTPCLDEIGRLTNLQFLGIFDCKGIEVLDLTELKSLRTILIGMFPDLVTVRGLSSRMVRLQVLRIEYCMSLRECPGLGELCALEILYFQGCGKLEELPYIGRLTNLREFDMNGCKSISKVPGLSDLIALEEVRVKGCLKLAALPHLGKLTKLRELDIKDSSVQGVPGLDGLVGLTKISASFGKVLEEQPVFPKMSALKVVYLHGCDGPILSRMTSLLMLEDLGLSGCKGEDVVPDLQNLKKLKTVMFVQCEYKDLLGLSDLTGLEDLLIVRCGKLERLPEFERLMELRRLRIRECDDLKEWPCASNLCSLRSLEVDGFALLKIVPDLETFTGLRDLTLCDQGCENVLSMASLSHLECLGLYNFATTGALDLSNFPHLKELKVFYCRAFKRLTCSIPLTSLTELEVDGCESLVEIPNLSTFPELEMLSLKNCGAFKRLTCSTPLTPLKKIKLIGCDQVEMPDLSRFPNLKELSVKQIIPPQI